MYLEPTTQEVAEGVWYIGGYSVANTSIIEAEDGLIVYDTGDNKEEARHIRAAIEKISIWCSATESRGICCPFAGTGSGDSEAFVGSPV